MIKKLGEGREKSATIRASDGLLHRMRLNVLAETKSTRYEDLAIAPRTLHALGRELITALIDLDVLLTYMAIEELDVVRAVVALFPGALEVQRDIGNAVAFVFIHCAFGCF